MYTSTFLLLVNLVLVVVSQPSHIPHLLRTSSRLHRPSLGPDFSPGTHTLVLQFNSEYPDVKVHREVSNVCGYSIGEFLKSGFYTWNCEILSEEGKDIVELLEAIPSVLWVGHVLPHHKFSRRDFVVQNQQRRGGGVDADDDSSAVVFLTALLTKSQNLRKKEEEEETEIPVALPSHASLVYTSTEKLIVRTRKEYREEVAEILSQWHSVHWIHPTRLDRKTNNLFMKKIVKSGILVDGEGSLLADYRGEGEIVAVGDSGLDFRHCFFYDDAAQVQFSKIPDFHQKVDRGHRKILHYWNLLDSDFFGEDDSSHGTHVCGTVAGKWMGDEDGDGEMSSWNGLAEDARLFFADLGCASEGGCECVGFEGCPCSLFEDGMCPKEERAIFPPLDLNKWYFPYAYHYGARIMSNSWGDDYVGYTPTAAEIDRFVWENDDFLVLFAAGNSGEEGSGWSTLDAEANCKNCLTIGASMNTVDDSLMIEASFRDWDHYRETFLKDARSLFGCDVADVCREPGSWDNITIEICDALNETTFDCCSMVGLCQPEDPQSSCGCEIPGSYGRAGDFCCESCRLQKLLSNDALHQRNDGLAYFSSRGPTQPDGRFKPDIVAPGYYLVSSLGRHETRSCSSAAFDTKELTFMAGTSMATPTAAAAAALVREWLVKVHHLDRVPAALVKALMIHSGEHLQGYLYIGGYEMDFNDAAYSNHYDTRHLEGFGRINLGNVIDNPNVVFETSAAPLETGETVAFCYSSSQATTKAKVTLVWTDYPSTPSRTRHLVNNLDLIVRVVNPEGPEHFQFGNALDWDVIRKDFTNNVQQVDWFDLGVGSRLVVLVTGESVPMNPQRFALVVSASPEGLRTEKCAEDEETQMFLQAGQTPSVTTVTTSPTGTVLIALLITIVVLLVAVLVVTIVLLASHCSRKQIHSSTAHVRLSEEGWEEAEMEVTGES